MNKRIEWIDVAKGLGILSVILTHCYIPETLLKHYLYSFHMPLFFILSGYFHKVDIQMNIIKKRFRTLIIPYVFFYITFIHSIFLLSNKN